MRYTITANNVQAESDELGDVRMSVDATDEDAARAQFEEFLGGLGPFKNVKVAAA